MIYPKALLDPAPLAKKYPDLNVVTGVVCHSMEGSWGAARARLMGNGPSDQVSWHFSILKDGTVYQHYETQASCWHAGNRLANTMLIGIEHEGVAGEPLTESQAAASVALVRWLAEQHAFPLQRSPGPSQSLYEHREVVGWSTPNAGPTACPSGRIPWERYTELELVKIVNSEAIAAVKEIVQAVGGQDGEFLAEVKDYDTPTGYVDYFVRTKR